MIPAHSALGPIASSVGIWNPVINLPNLIWFLHPDDATGGDIIAGEINTLTCRKSGIVFTAPSATARMARNTTERTGHAVASCVTTNDQDFLVGADAGIAGALDGNTAFTIFHFKRLTTTAAGTRNSIQHGIPSTYSLAGSHGIQIQQTSSTNMRIQRVQAGGGRIYNVAFTATTNWEFHMWTFDGTTGAEFFINNVSQGTATAIQNTPTGMQNVLWGAGLSYHSVSGCCTGVMSSADRTKLYAWVLANA